MSTDKPTCENTYIATGKTLVIKVENSPGSEETFKVLKGFSFMEQAALLGYTFEETSDTPSTDQFTLVSHLLENNFIAPLNTRH